jgi:hypothetical protein
MIIEGDEKCFCLGYGAFVDRLESNPLLTLLGRDLADRAKMERNYNRLVGVQHALVDLIVFLDKEGIRFAENRISKMGLQNEAAGHWRKHTVPIYRQSI